VVGNGRHSLKIIHTADIHLGDDLQPELARHAFLAVLEQVRAETADLLIIAGDLFDSNRAARVLLDFALAELGRLDVPVVVLPGNHDPFDDSSVYREVVIRERCPQIHLMSDLEGGLLRFPEMSLTLWGKPVVEHCPRFRPLGNIPERMGNDWHVAVAHGFHVPEGEVSHRSSPISDAAIANTGWDYLALGHVHPYRDVSGGGVIACYSGSPAHFKALEGSAGRVALVELDARRGVSVRPVEIER
jgi:DNA repair exonuclease SbcCD nuclease subunit